MSNIVFFPACGLTKYGNTVSFLENNQRFQLESLPPKDLYRYFIISLKNCRINSTCTAVQELFRRNAFSVVYRTLLDERDELPFAFASRLGTVILHYGHTPASLQSLGMQLKMPPVVTD